MWKDTPGPKQTEKPKLHTLHSVFSPFGKRTISFRIAWILAHRFSVSVSHHNYKSILGNKKLFIWNLTVFHSFNSGWHSSRAEILEVACLLYSATAIQRQNSGPHFSFCSLILRTAAQVAHTKSLETSMNIVRHATELPPSSAKNTSALAVNWLHRKGWLSKKKDFQNKLV